MIGPVDYVLVEFPVGASSFTGEVGAELRAMAGSGGAFASAVRRSGGQLIAGGRIPVQGIIASIGADEATATVAD